MSSTLHHAMAELVGIGPPAVRAPLEAAMTMRLPACAASCRLPSTRPWPRPGSGSCRSPAAPDGYGNRDNPFFAIASKDILGGQAGSAVAASVAVTTPPPARNRHVQS